MDNQIHSTTRSPSTASSSGGDVAWSNPSNITANDGSNATIGFFEGGQEGGALAFYNFGFTIPEDAVIDGLVLTIDGSAFSVTGSVNLDSDNGIGTGKSSGVLNGAYGGSEDLWGLVLTPALVNDADFGGYVAISDTSGGDGSASIDHVEITVYWHYDLSVDPTEVPIRHIYKAYSNNGEFLGNIPNVLSPFGFSQDINSAGSAISIEVGLSPDTTYLPGDRIVTEAGDPIITEGGDYLRTEGQPQVLATGDSDETSILIKNGNRIKVFEYSYYYPNGKLMFTGQINRVEAGVGGGDDDKIKVLVLSDGIDLDNLIARGAPFTYTNDQSQTAQNSSATIYAERGTWNQYGQLWTTGVGITNLGAITIYLNGIADVTVRVYSGANGTELASVERSVNTAGVAAAVQFAFPTLLTVVASTQYFFTVEVGDGQSILIYYSNANPYASGAMYNSLYGGAGGGSYAEVSGSDLYFVTATGTASTLATYTSKDPSTEMLSPILTDYNLRGGRITEGEFDATGLSLTATFNTETVYDALEKCLAMSPNGFYFYVDLGTNELDFLEASATADYTFIKGRHLDSIKLVMSIENVKNQLLFSGGDTGGGSNLYKQYQDTESMTLYGVRLERKSDNRVTVTATANAIGDSFIDENKDEQNQTTVKIPYKTMDITLLTPGKVIGFAGFGTFIDNILIRIVRREYTSESVTLTLGMLPPQINPVIEQITRGLLAEQTVANPSTPS